MKLPFNFLKPFKHAKIDVSLQDRQWGWFWPMGNGSLTLLYIRVCRFQVHLANRCYFFLAYTFFFFFKNLSILKFRIFFRRTYFPPSLWKLEDLKTLAKRLPLALISLSRLFTCSKCIKRVCSLFFVCLKLVYYSHFLPGLLQLCEFMTPAYFLSEYILKLQTVLIPFANLLDEC